MDHSGKHFEKKIYYLAFGRAGIVA